MILDPNISLVVIALLNCLTAFITWRTHQQSKMNGQTIASLEKNTNSIKDALVASTAKASFAEGRADGKRAGVETAKELLAHNQAREDAKKENT